MIRRDDAGDFLLITQHDHALLAGMLAEQFGNEMFAAPEPRAQTIRGVALHDCGWPLHDDAPTRNSQGLPSDVFETVRPVALKVWAASADRASAEHPYAGLLTSLHVLSLSVFATSETSFAHEKFDLDNPQDRFAVIKFQQHEIARQEDLRQRLGLRAEKPLHHAGLPKQGMQRAEDQLQFNFRMLQAMDAISLAACCTSPPMSQTQDVFRKPAGEKVKLSLARRGNDVLVDPWPFATREIALQIPACRVPGKAYGSDDELRAAYSAGSAEVLTARVLPGRA
ncbi:MAG TPA: DUF3891 family protein [Tepidisphaeraceae bacterium]|nr:DUF3891 family protein [Tepidisphaeraceae bacterium]